MADVTRGLVRDKSGFVKSVVAICLNIQIVLAWARLLISLVVHTSA